MAGPIFDLLNDINFRKEYLLTEDMEKEYLPYIINHFLSGTPDTLLYAQEMNMRSSLDKKMQFDYLFHSVPKKKRFSKWLKKEKYEELVLVQKLYSCNKKKARIILSLLSEDQVNFLKAMVDTGGKE